MAATVLVGLVFLFWLVQEARAALAEAREAGEQGEGTGLPMEEP